MLAELVMMRLFDDFQEVVKGVAVRLACGATYADGTPPVLLIPSARSTTQALSNFENVARTKPKSAQWSKYAFIKETVENVIHPADPFLKSCSAGSAQIADMQVIRNRIAHTGIKNYPKLVRRHYGATMNHITPGVLLLSPRNSPPLLERYIATSRVLAKSLSRS